MKFYLLLLLSLAACSSAPKEQDPLLEKLTALEQKVDELNKELQKQDSLSLEKPTEDAAASRELEKTSDEKELPLRVEKPKEEKKTPTIEKNPTQPIIVNTDKEKIYYYQNGKKSVVISPWVDGRRTTTLYDPWEKETYQFDERRMSFSIIAEVVEFHPNGAVSKVNLSNHPDASMYWYESTYTFGINNQPEWMYSTQYPQTTLTMPGDNAYYWDKKKGTWVKQEVAIETITPNER
jgi:hypothetical protein